jgi:hypothetical protein
MYLFKLLFFVRVANCVGYRNYRYFVSFLFWATVATVYVSTLSFSQIMRTGSLLFPESGTPVHLQLYNRFIAWGGERDQRNIYMVLYDTLSGKELDDDRKTNVRIAKKARLRKQREASAAVVQDTLPVVALDLTKQPQEHRHLLESEYIVIDRHQRMLGGEEADVAVFPDAREATLKGSDKFRSVGIDSFFSMATMSVFMLPADMLMFMAFMLSTGVWIGTGALLALHTSLSTSKGHTLLPFHIFIIYIFLILLLIICTAYSCWGVYDNRIL